MSGDWPHTIWSEARQIGALLRWPAMPGDTAPPDRFFEALRADGRDREAALFLGQALPRYEAVAWAAETVARHDAGADGQMMDAVRGWLGEPSEELRRAAHALVETVRKPNAAQHCALAVFTSGGSVAPPDKPPHPAPKDAAGRFAAAAVLMATAAAPDRAAALRDALDLGVRLARGGQEQTP